MDDEARLLAKFEQLTAVVAESHRIEPESAERLALVDLATACADEHPDELPELFVETLTVALEDPVVLEHTTMLIGPLFDVERRPGFGRLLEAAMARHGGDAAGINVAMARYLETAGDLPAMERHLRQAVRLDPGHLGAHEDLGELAQLGGDAAAARRHLDRAGRPPWGWAAIAESLNAGPRRPKRNEPCPCGSGDRFKHCCAKTSGLSFAQRTALLPHRIDEWLDRPAGRHSFLPLACTAAGVGSLHDAPARVIDATQVPVLRALRLFEGGGLASLLPAIAPVLPADEAEAARSWPAARHRLYEVGRPDVRDSWHLRDVLTGDEVLVGQLGDAVLQTDADHLFAVLVDHPTRHEPSHLAWGEPVAVVDGEVDTVARAVERRAGPEDLVELLVTPGLTTFGQLLDLERRATPAVASRAEWLLGPVARGFDRLDLLDDLVTTTFMRGGGFSPAADLIRLAARRIVEAEPPQVWEAAQRLAAVGVDRESIVVEVAAAWFVAEREAGPDPDARHRCFVARLDALPLQRLAG